MTNIIIAFVANRKSFGFSLIELLVVLVILGMLASMVAPRVTRYLSTAKTKTAKVQIEELGTALDLYRLEVGGYPTTEQGLKALIKAPDKIENWNGPYITKMKIPSDPWGQNYNYKYPGQHLDYDLFSYGADKAPGGDGDKADILYGE